MENSVQVHINLEEISAIVGKRSNFLGTIKVICIGKCGIEQRHST